jgi:hydrogenase/urease accessory protein HupE
MSVGPVVHRKLLVAAVMLVTMWPAGPRVRGHELERTQVVLSFDADGNFILEIANDPAWLLLRLESFAGVSASPPTSPETRDARLHQLASVFIDRVVLFVDGREIRPDVAEYVPPREASSTTDIPLGTYRLRGHMPHDARVLRWLYGLVLDPYPLRIERADGATYVEWIQGSNWSDTIDLSGQFRRASTWEVTTQYLALGYTHILPKGLDHILFVLGLFLLSARMKPLLIQVTAFTAAHSLTLALSILGVVALPPRVVEPLIALSIAYVAIENVWTTQLKPWRLMLVFFFGLLHGMGFAGVLTDLGLPRDELVVALLSFNVGVEAGQLSVILLATFSLVWWRHQTWYRQRIVVPASLAIAMIGLYWTVTRIAA